jgi:hypothetical protein
MSTVDTNQPQAIGFYAYTARSGTYVQPKKHIEEARFADYATAREWAEEGRRCCAPSIDFACSVIAIYPTSTFNYLGE